MARIQRYDAQAPLTPQRAVTAQAPQMSDAIPRAIAQTVGELSDRIIKVHTAREVSEGIAQYNRAVNEYMNDLQRRDPRENFVGDFENMSKKVKDDIIKRSGFHSREYLNNKFNVWDEQNRGSIANLQARMTVAVVKQEMPEKIKEALKLDQPEIFEDYLEGVSDALSPREIDMARQEFVAAQERNEIFQAINIAIDNPSPEAQAFARETIDKYSKTEDERYSHLQRIRAGQGQQRSLRNAAFNARMNSESRVLGETFAQNEALPADFDVLPENQEIVSMLSGRQAAGNVHQSLDQGLTYRFMIDQINYGNQFSEQELTSAFGSALSSDEYNEIRRLNAEIIKLNDTQREEVRTLNEAVSARYGLPKTIMRNRLTPNQFAKFSAAIHHDRTQLQNQVRRMVANGRPTNEVYDAIEAHFLGTEENLVKPFYRRWPGKRASDFEDEVRDASDIEDRWGIIADITKRYLQGEESEFDRLPKLIGEWRGR